MSNDREVEFTTNVTHNGKAYAAGDVVVTVSADDAKVLEEKGFLKAPGAEVKSDTPGPTAPVQGAEGPAAANVSTGPAAGNAAANAKDAAKTEATDSGTSSDTSAAGKTDDKGAATPKPEAKTDGSKVDKDLGKDL